MATPSPCQSSPRLSRTHHDCQPSSGLSGLSLRDSLGDPDVDAGQVSNSPYLAGDYTTLLNADVLRQIFDLILFVHPHFQGASTHDLSDCLWNRHLRSAKRLLLVCKRWHAYALPYLYREVALRCIGQLPALVRTVRSAPQLFGPLIGSLRLLCDVPSAYVDLTLNCLRYLLVTCTSLRKLAFEEAFVLRVGVELRWDNSNFSEVFKNTANARSQFPHLSQTLHELTFVNQWPYDHNGHDAIFVPAAFIASFSNLSKLSVNALKVDNNSKTEPLTLPALVDLTIYYCTNTLDRMPVEWDMPNLRQFRLRNRFWGQAPAHISIIPNLMQFFDQAGQTLTHVDFGCSDTTWPLLVNIVDKCPNRCHLALGAPEPWSDDLRKMRGVQYVDFFWRRNLRGHIHWQPVLAANVATHLARIWPKIRVLDRSLLLVIPNLPTFFPPDEPVSDKLEHDICGHMIVQTKDAVFHKAIHIEDDDDDDTDFEYNGEGEEEEEEETDPDTLFWSGCLCTTGPPGTEDHDSDHDTDNMVDHASSWSVEEGVTRTEWPHWNIPGDHTSDLSDTESEEMAVDDTEQVERGDSDEEMGLEADIEAMDAEMLEWNKYMSFAHGEEREAYPQIDEDEALRIFSETVDD